MTMIWPCFESEISNMCCLYKNVVLTGDTNAHTAQSPDYILVDDFLADHFDFDESTIDFFNKTDILLNNDFYLNRTSKDTKTNTIGNLLLDICKNNNVFILNGRAGKDKGVGNFTFRNKSVIDYTLVSSDCINFITNFDIRDLDPLFSDGHALLSLNVNLHLNKQAPVESRTDSTKPPKWDDTKKSDFIQNLDREQLIQINNMLDSFSIQNAKVQ